MSCSKSMLYSNVRRFFSFLIKTPLHPQWLASIQRQFDLKGELSKLKRGLLLDIGCSDKKFKKIVPEEIKYIGLDYYTTATYLYKSRPDCYGDGRALPFADNSFDIVIIKDVLEHISEPWLAFKEISRVLKDGGMLLVTVPFLYPLHDAPYDYHRFTIYSLRHAAEKFGYSIKKEIKTGTPMETAALLGNIAAARVTLEMLRRYNPVGLLMLMLLPVYLICSNLVGWSMGKISPTDYMMPFSITVLMFKES